MFFALITKNLDWKILTKNLVAFKIWDGVKDGILWGFTEKSDFWVDCRKRWLGQFAGLREGLGKKRGCVFEGG